MSQHPHDGPGSEQARPQYPPPQYPPPQFPPSQYPPSQYPPQPGAPHQSNVGHGAPYGGHPEHHAAVNRFIPNLGPNLSQKPSPLWALSVPAAIFFFPFGLVAVYFSWQVNECLRAGDLAGAAKNAGLAKTWGAILLGLGVIAWLSVPGYV